MVVWMHEREHVIATHLLLSGVELVSRVWIGSSEGPPSPKKREVKGTAAIFYHRLGHHLRLHNHCEKSAVINQSSVGLLGHIDILAGLILSGAALNLWYVWGFVVVSAVPSISSNLLGGPWKQRRLATTYPTYPHWSAHLSSSRSSHGRVISCWDGSLTIYCIWLSTRSKCDCALTAHHHTGGNDSEQFEAPDALCCCIPACLPACLACPRLEKRARSWPPGRGNQRLSGQFLGEAALPPSSPESNDGDPASAAGTSYCQEGIRQDEGDDVHEIQSHESGSGLLSIIRIFLPHMTLPKHRSHSFFLQACQ